LSICIHLRRPTLSNPLFLESTNDLTVHQPKPAGHFSGEGQGYIHIFAALRVSSCKRTAGQYQYRESEQRGRSDLPGIGEFNPICVEADDTPD
jgi:hypothetical protein